MNGPQTGGGVSQVFEGALSVVLMADPDIHIEPDIQILLENDDDGVGSVSVTVEEDISIEVED
jgi:hypothetical protein